MKRESGTFTSLGAKPERYPQLCAVGMSKNATGMTREGGHEPDDREPGNLTKHLINLTGRVSPQENRMSIKSRPTTVRSELTLTNLSTSRLVISVSCTCAVLWMLIASAVGM